MEDKVEFVKSLIFNNCGIWNWELDRMLPVIKTNCPYPKLMSKLMATFCNKEYFERLAQQDGFPMVICDSLALTWVICAKQNGNKISSLHVLGPVYSQENSSYSVRQLLESLNIADAQMKRVMWCMQRIPVCLSNAFLTYGAMLHEALNGVTIQINSFCYEMPLKPENENRKLSRVIQICCEYIDIHADEDIKTKELADMVGYVDYYLTRKFKNEVGISLNEYIKKARISQAKHLLESTSASITEISERLHFCNGGYFTTVFQKMTGITPSEYRANAKKSP